MDFKYANKQLYSDTEPYEIIRVVSDKTLEIRSMTCEVIKNDKLNFHVGGFAGHCSNQEEQEWNIKSNPNGYVTRIRLNKHGQWKNGSTKFYLSNTPTKFYDYNF